jgi:putative membrane protein
MIIPGFHVLGGIFTILSGAIALTLMHLILRPILSIISFPINMITLGLFSIVINTFIIYLLTVFINGISIVPFHYPGAEIAGFIVPVISFSMLLAYIYTSFVLSCVDSFLRWMMR